MLWLILGLLFGLALPLPASANPDLDKAIRLSGELEFNQALRAFQKALDSGKLSRSELAQLLAERALLLHALRRQPEVVSDFRWLAAVDPSYKLDSRAPPDLTAIWESLRREAGGAAKIELRDESSPGRLRLRPLVKGAHPEGLRIDAYFRVGGGAYEPLDEALGVERNYPQGADVQAYASLIGLGQVQLSSAGNPENPLAFVVPPAGNAAVAVAGGGFGSEPETTPADSKKRIDPKWLWIGGAAAVVVVVVVTAAVLAGGGEDSKDVRLTPVANF
ncbi:MAG: hypothetical protein QM778_29630 [Myxococcales bacterium]